MLVNKFKVFIHMWEVGVGITSKLWVTVGKYHLSCAYLW